ncbi:hypothetical protein Poli38472_006407 [Pythium oligandrum]|uniref:Amino acid transporter transmembrane domain-containing protein n=1 Tax=Pythium oligandrum TaxID=41045 RepID=A0A8K1C5D8_PYTOL|nr:hypothetical protein Poli38472_006407 [Pythium oligandrum]|eukprot:TMW56397.1 hypothetical protein Poli38472_006407 [Pythium oligandrum]
MTSSAPPSTEKDDLAMVESGVYRYERKGSREYFSPGPHSKERTATSRSAVFNLVSTIIGGGVLSLPYAFDKCGLVLAVVFMVISAAASNFSLYVIVSSSRRGSAATYEEVVRKALGVRAGLITVTLLVMLTFLTLVAYTILVKDLVGTLAGEFLYGRLLSVAEKNVLTIICISLVSPFLFAKSMDALRFTSIFSLASVFTLAMAITIRSVYSPPSDVLLLRNDVPIKLFPDNWKDPVYAFPIISVSFLCHFNVLPVYRELKKPTRRRLKNIVTCTMASTWFFYMVVGFTGYFFAYRQVGGVKDDILNNFAGNDQLVNIGRLGLLVTILLSMPLIIQPCRRNSIRLYTYVQGFLQSSNQSSEELRLLTTPTVTREPLQQTAPVLSPKITHALLTILILTSTVSLALVLPGVAVVWNIMGSTVGLLISYVLPCISYALIRQNKPHTDRRRLTAWVIFAISAVVCVACTVQAVLSITGLS